MLMGLFKNSRCLLLVCFLGGSVLPATVAKSGFLRQSIRDVSKLRLKIGAVHQELEEVLTEAMGYGHGMEKARLEEKTATISQTFKTMPKNLHGRVGRDAVQYMVQRYFAYEHGWSIKGFDTASSRNSSSESGSSSGSSGSVKILRQKLPGYVESLMQEKLELHGFGLHDVVTMVVVLERLIFDEGLEMLEDAYYLQREETSELLSEAELMEVIYAYMMIYGYEGDRKNRTLHEETLVTLRKDFPKGWPSGEYGMAETRSLLEGMRRKNPFADRSRGYPFEVAAQAASTATERYGKWSSQEECRELKDALTELDREGNGRVRLTDFYAKGSVAQNWFFEETPEYLQELGVLDATSASRGIQLVIPNYVQSASNCIEASSFYSICCLKECDSLLGEIEGSIQAPMASPSRILPVVQRLLSSKHLEDKNVTTQLVAHLEAIAEHHMGNVPLHGRLFSQWLHYVFPLECPYPQKSDNVVTSVISEYSTRTGLPSVLTPSEMKAFVETHRMEGTDEEDLQDLEKDAGEMCMSQWSMEEELYVGYHHQGPRDPRKDGGVLNWSVLGGLARFGIIFGGLVSFVLPVATRAYASFTTMSGDRKAIFGRHGGEVFV